MFILSLLLHNIMYYITAVYLAIKKNILKRFHHLYFIPTVEEFL